MIISTHSVGINVREMRRDEKIRLSKNSWDSFSVAGAKIFHLIRFESILIDWAQVTAIVTVAGNPLQIIHLMNLNLNLLRANDRWRFPAIQQAIDFVSKTRKLSSRYQNFAPIFRLMWEGG